jgi:LuxR family maltose regulon positive regulatory protein
MTRLPTVRDGMLLTSPTEPPIAVGTTDWSDWLDAARSFAYRGAAGRFTARQEERSGRRFWYAYRQQDGTLRKTYLGRSAELTAERLDEAARTLAEMARTDANDDKRTQENIADAWLSPLIATKIAAPVATPSLMARPGVLARCLEAVERPCAIIAAPAGFGKTTLLMMASEQAQEHGWQIAWVSLEESEQDPTRFWQYTLAGLDGAQPGISATARHMLELPRSAPIERMLTILINDLAAATAPILLVLDDYHRTATPAIDQGLVFLIEHAPAMLHLLIATRSTPAFPMARLRAQGRIAELDAADLRFSVDEANRFMRETMRVTLPPEQLAHLEERTEGWVAGLQLAALSLRNQHGVPNLATAGDATPRYIAEFLIDEVLERQPEDIQAFLLLTSPLERLTGPLCDAVTGRRDSAAVLARLTQEQLFVTPLDAAQTWYRYHHLFAEVLRERLARRMPDEVKQCHHLAADWLWQHGMPDDAIRHLLAAGMFAEAAAHIEQESDRLVLHGEVAGLARWGRALPRDVVLAHPHLCLLFAVALLLQGEEPDATAWLDALDKRYGGQEGLPATIRGEFAAVRSFLMLWSGNIMGGARLAREALQRLPPSDRLLRALTLWISHVIGIFGEGNLAEAERIIGEVAEDSLRGGNMLVAFIALATKASAQIYQGRLHEAAQVCTEALRLLPGQDVPIAAMSYCILGEIRREWNELDAAEAILRHALAISEQAGNPEYINDGLLYLAQVLLARGRIDDALVTLERIRIMVQMRQLAPWDLSQMEIIRARVLIARGALDEAGRWASERLRRRQHGNRVPTAPLAFMYDLEDLSIARVLLARGDADAAMALMEPLAQRAEETGQWRNLMEARMLLAQARWLAGDTNAATCMLHAALTIAAPEGFVRVFLDEGEVMADLLAHYLANQPTPSASASAREREHARGLLAAFGRTVAAPTSDNPLDVLSPREADVLRLLATGRSNEEIAGDLVLALSTVKWHVAHIYRKLGVRGRMQAVARARELRLIA